VKRLAIFGGSGKSWRNKRMSMVGTFFSILLAAFAIGGIILTYLLDSKRLRADVGHWLVEVDRTQRLRAGSNGDRLPSRDSRT
jgi:hypothetical protein